jgi:hypothetical protein
MSASCAPPSVVIPSRAAIAVSTSPELTAQRASCTRSCRSTPRSVAPLSASRYAARAIGSPIALSRLARSDSAASRCVPVACGRSASRTSACRNRYPAFAGSMIRTASAASKWSNAAPSANPDRAMNSSVSNDEPTTATRDVLELLRCGLGEVAMNERGDVVGA